MSEPSRSRSVSTSTDSTMLDYEFKPSMSGERSGSPMGNHRRVHRPRTTKITTWQCCKCCPADHPHRADKYYHAHHITSFRRTITIEEFEQLPYDDHYSESNSSGSSKLSEKARRENKIDEVLSRDGTVIQDLDLVSTPAPEGHFSHVPDHITLPTEVYYTRDEVLEGEEESETPICMQVQNHPDPTLQEQITQNIVYKVPTSYGHHKCRDCLEYTKVVYCVKNGCRDREDDYEPVVVRMPLADGEKFHRSKQGWIDSNGDRRMVVRDFAGLGGV